MCRPQRRPADGFWVTVIFELRTILILCWFGVDCQNKKDIKCCIFCKCLNRFDCDLNTQFIFLSFLGAV